ncbi:MAG: flagellar filament capping protein FliD [Bryobacteraceae bacterium]|jgi:flagellar hook-associated protein 2
MGTTPAATFNGNSQYAGDLQQAITNAVTVASIPMDNLQTNVTTLQSQSSELSALQSSFSSLQSAIQSISSATTGAGGLTASASNTAVASVSIDSTSDATAGTYTLNVKGLGAPTTTLSEVGSTVSDPSSTSISSASSFTLTVGSSTFTIAPTANTLDALAQAINSANAGVNATIVNLGSSSAPDYRLSLQSTTLGDETIQLNDGSQNLLTTLTPGSDAQYQVDGQPSTPISSNSDTVTIAPGVSVSLLGTGQTTVTVASDPSAAANALSSFVAAYNAASQTLGQNHGTSGGPLTGQSIIFELEQALRNISGYAGGSGVATSMADLGLTFNDSSGALSFDASQFESVAASNPNDVANFLGSISGDTGFLGSTNDLLTGLDDTTNGTIQASINTLNTQITSDQTQITTDQANITTMQNSLTAQMVQADTLISSLESQVTYFTDLFTATQDAIANG